MQKSTHFVAFLFAFLAIAGSAHAQLSLGNKEEPPKVKAQLIAENDGIAPGKPFWVAVRQEITPHWHTYWKNPGDTGLASEVKWELPQGFSAGELVFPTPARHKMSGMVNFGYEESVMLLTEITPPSDAKIGDTIHLKAKASWLVCNEVCIPEKSELTLDLPVMEKPVGGPWASAFKAVRETLPRDHSSVQTVAVVGDTLEITLNPLPLAADEMPEEAFFFPHDGLLIQHNQDQKMELNGRQIKLVIPRNVARTDAIEKVTGDVWLRTMTGAKSYKFDAAIQKKTEAAPVAAATAPTETQSGGSLLLAMLSALLGGVLLNLMPCVFPVLSLKALGLVQKSHEKKHGKIIAGGMAYLAGVLATFTLLGVVLITLKSAGSHIGWGVQLQSPVFVAALALLLFFIGYTLTGAVNLGTSLMGVGHSLTQKSSIAGSFFTGALAVVVATPCTAPFMGGAIFFALTQSWMVTLLVLWALGLGLALPYVLLTLFPQVLLKYLPKPGVWMEHFKQFLAFPMLGAAIWLVWVLGQQTGATGVLYALNSMLMLAFAFWLWGTTQNRPNSAWQYTKIILALVTLMASLWFVLMQPKAAVIAPAQEAKEGAYYESYTPEKLQAARAAGKPVFVNMTAAWCITCLANEKAALDIETTKKFFKDNGILFLKGDWTNYDDSITQYLKSFGRSGVPIYVFYPADQTKAPVVLPQLLTPGIVINAISPLTNPKS